MNKTFSGIAAGAAMLALAGCADYGATPVTAGAAPYGTTAGIGSNGIANSSINNGRLGNTALPTLSNPVGPGVPAATTATGALPVGSTTRY